MNEITPQQAKFAVLNFLHSQFEKKSDTEQKQLSKAQEDGDAEKFAELTLKIAEIKEKYQRDAWLDDAVNRMAKQLNFGTHISKGVHPDAKGDNVTFKSNHELPTPIVGTHSIQSEYLDANGNAAALPLAAFFDFQVSDGIKIRDLVLSDNSDFIDSLASNHQQAKIYHAVFKDALQNSIDQPSSHERNKQTLWVTNSYDCSNIDDLKYIAIVPLYPSVLTFETYQRINQLRYSDENKSALENRFKKNAEQRPYVSMLNLATVQLGGTKPQNVSQLMSKQGGRNYLLPSLPPMIGRDFNFRLSKFKRSIFDNNALIYPAREAIQDIFSVVKSTNKNVDIRNTLKEAIDNVLHILFGLVHSIRTRLPAGWSKDFALDMPYKYWLDPKRPALPDEEEFALGQTKEDWHEIIINHFADWLNALLKAEFPKQSSDIAYPEHKEWKREIEAMKKQYEREGRGIF